MLERLHLNHVISVLLTFLAVLVAQVFFRARNTRAACSMLVSMAGLHNHSAPNTLHTTTTTILLLILGYAVVWSFPNTQQILLHFKPALEVTRFDEEKETIKVSWKPNELWALTLGILFVLSLVKMQDPTTFLYFQF